MNKRQKKKLFNRCNIWHYAEFKNITHRLPKRVKKFFRMYANANYKLMHTKLPKNIYREDFELLSDYNVSALPTQYEIDNIARLANFSAKRYAENDIPPLDIKQSHGICNTMLKSIRHGNKLRSDLEEYDNDLMKFMKQIEVDEDE